MIVEEKEDSPLFIGRPLCNFPILKTFSFNFVALNTKYNIQNNKHVKIPCLWFLFLSDPGVLNLGEYFSNSKYSPNYLEIYSIYSPNIFQIYMEKNFPGKIFLKSHIFSIYMQNRFHIFPIFCFPFPVSWIRGKYGKSLMKEFRQRASCFPIHSKYGWCKECSFVWRNL